MQNTYIAVSKEITGQILPFTEANENYIAQMKIQKLLDSGKSEREIAMIWNGTLGGSEKPIAKKGKTAKAKYDTVAYADNVISNLNK